MPRCPPILKRPFKSYTAPRAVDHEPTTSSKHWTAYLLPCFAVVLLLLPQPSWFILITSQYSSTSTITRWIHFSITTLLTLGSINSLAICCFADPGRPTPDDLDAAEETYSSKKKKTSRSNRDSVDGEEEAEALMSEEDDDPNSFNSSLKWCRSCWAPKPDRTHHCSTCNRCVLKMDHHCPWVSQCVGHRTYPSFLHLLLCVSFLASYIAVVASYILYSFLFTPIAQPIDDTTPLHCLLLVVMGFVFSIVMGSFAGYHIYLSFTNQTTVEQLSPYMLLKYLPKPRVPRHAPGTSITHQVSNSSASAEMDSPYHFPSPPPTPPLNKSALDTPVNPLRVFSSSPVATTAREAYLQSPSTRGYHEWDEHALSSAQRRLVRHTASNIRLYDLGWKMNVKANLGGGLTKRDAGSRRRDARHLRPYSWRWWLSVLLYGGPPRGDGKTFPRNRRAKAALHELRARLEQLEQNERGITVRGDGEGEEHEMDEV